MYMPGEEVAESMAGRQEEECDFFQLYVWLNWIVNLQVYFPKDTDFGSEALLRIVCSAPWPS